MAVGLVGGCTEPAARATGASEEPTVATSSGASATTPRAAIPAPTPSASGASSVGRFRSVRHYVAVASPTRLRIPDAGVNTSLVPLGLTPEGWIEAPAAWDVAGWYVGGPRPGQRGPAVIVGHVDSRSGPAVFHRLPDVGRGALIHVDRRDGSSATFRVTGHRQVSKEHFPATEVYAPTLEAALILITCGGIFDPVSGHYRDNIIVTAVPV